MKFALDVALIGISFNFALFMMSGVAALWEAYKYWNHPLIDSNPFKILFSMTWQIPAYLLVFNLLYVWRDLVIQTATR